MYVVWDQDISQTPDDNDVSKINNSDFEKIQMGIEKGIACALKINSECNNYKISFSPKEQEASSFRVKSKINKFSGDSLDSIIDDVELMTSLKAPVEEVVYLSVHSGISVGVLAGAKVSASDRSEYLLLGKPLHNVAIAEKLAGKGELVITNKTYNYLMGGESINQKQIMKDKTITVVEEIIAKCSFTELESGCYKVIYLAEESDESGDHTPTAEKTITASRPRLLRRNSSSDNSKAQRNNFYNQMKAFISEAFIYHSSGITKILCIKIFNYP